jgi:uncharacterized membrane protein
VTAEQIFSIANAVAVIGWLILIFAGRRPWASGLVAGVVLPGLLSIAYVTILLGHWIGSEGGFGSLAQVAALFSNPWLLLAGWLHYLAFDLFVGSWEVRDAVRNAVPHLLVIPCLIFTFLFGPAGFLLYLAIRGFRRRTVTIDESVRR